MTMNFRHMNHSGMFPWPGVYFHGRAEQFVRTQISDGSAPDLVAGPCRLHTHKLAADNYTVLKTTPHFTDTFEPCTVYGVPAVLALWYPPGAPTMARGMIFLAEDDEARAYALTKFRAQSFTL